MCRTRQLWVLVVSILAVFQIAHVNAVELGSFGQRIFQFQEKLAQGGNTLAQYKLGTLYEFGVSVKPDLEKARVWYKKAAAKGYKPAINRLTYLDVKKSGFDEKKHTAWFEDVLAESESSEANALILLGQMNRHGIAVEKNLNQAIVFLQRASSLGHTEVDGEIDDIKHQIRQQREKRVQEKAKEQEIAKAKAKAKPKPKPKAKAKPKKKEVAKAKKNKESAAEKRKRYEEAMRKLYRENLILRQQQDWAESEEALE